MLSNKHFLGFMLIALLFIVSCTSKPIDLESEDLRVFANVTRKQSRAMHCTGRHNNINICQDAGNDMVSASQYYAINSHLLNDSPSTGSYKSYSVCNTADSCLSMKTLTGSTFAPYNYRHVTKEAFKIFDAMAVCPIVGSMFMRPTAFDIYLYEYNFLYSWWFESAAPIIARCGN